MDPVKGSDGYRADVAFIHDAAFGDWAQQGTHAIVAKLRHAGITSGLVVDLGCGSGIAAEVLTEAGYSVFGVDQSAPMLELARRRVPSAEFVCGSVLDVALPACRSMIAIGEVFNYSFDERVEEQSLSAIFSRCFAALEPGGLFVFDVACSGRVPEGRSAGFKRTDDWAILYEAVEEGYSLTREITTFRRKGAMFERSDELHRLRLYVPARISSALIAAGFEVEVSDRFGATRFAPGHAVFTAAKPQNG
jgi:SAM-dependent methyltransferase